MTSVNLPLALLHVLLLVTSSSLAFFPDILPRSAPGGRGAFTTSRLSLPPRTRPVERRDSSNTSSTNSTSNSSDFLWLIQDTYDHTNFFKCVYYCLLCSVLICSREGVRLYAICIVSLDFIVELIQHSTLHSMIERRVLLLMIKQWDGRVSVLLY